MSSEHVVVKRDLLETLSRAAESGAMFSFNNPKEYRQASLEAKDILAEKIQPTSLICILQQIEQDAKSISQIIWGYDGDCGSVSLANEIEFNARNAKAILSAPAPEMVPMSEIKDLLDALEVIASGQSDIASNPDPLRIRREIARDAIQSFNAKFKA